MISRIRLLVLVGLLLAGPASADMPGMRLDDRCLVKVWGPEESELATSKQWRDENDRLSFAPYGPQGSEAMQFYSLQDTPSGIANFETRLDAARESRASVARIRADFFIPPDTRFNVGAAKLPLGLWGGRPESNGCSTGGCAPEDQTGFSVRLSRAPTVAEVPDRHGPVIYSYHLNRHSKRWGAEHSNKVREVARTSFVYGESFPMQVDFPLGEWFTLTLDVALNDVTGDRPSENGSVDLYMHDEAGTLLGEVSAEGLVFRPVGTWYIHGPMLSDMWGGKMTSPRRMPVMDTLTFTRDYEMFLLEDGRSLEECRLPTP